MAKEIVTSSGHVILVDDRDFDYLNQFKWRIAGGGYAVRWARIAPGKKGRSFVLMHREILGLNQSDMRVCDHKNRIKTDNRRANLRICTPRQNAFNMPAYGSSGLKGVCWDKQLGKWACADLVIGQEALTRPFRNARRSKRGL